MLRGHLGGSLGGESPGETRVEAPAEDGTPDKVGAPPVRAGTRASHTGKTELADPHGLVHSLPSFIGFRGAREARLMAAHGCEVCVDKFKSENRAFLTPRFFVVFVDKATLHLGVVTAHYFPSIVETTVRYITDEFSTETVEEGKQRISYESFCTKDNLFYAGFARPADALRAMGLDPELCSRAMIPPDFDPPVIHAPLAQATGMVALSPVKGRDFDVPIQFPIDGNTAFAKRIMENAAAFKGLASFGVRAQEDPDLFRGLVALRVVPEKWKAQLLQFYGSALSALADADGFEVRRAADAGPQRPLEDQIDDALRTYLSGRHGHPSMLAAATTEQSRTSHGTTFIDGVRAHWTPCSVTGTARAPCKASSWLRMRIHDATSSTDVPRTLASPASTKEAAARVVAPELTTAAVTAAEALFSATGSATDPLRVAKAIVKATGRSQLVGDTATDSTCAQGANEMAADGNPSPAEVDNSSSVPFTCQMRQELVRLVATIKRLRVSALREADERGTDPPLFYGVPADAIADAERGGDSRNSYDAELVWKARYLAHVGRVRTLASAEDEAYFHGALTRAEAAAAIAAYREKKRLGSGGAAFNGVVVLLHSVGGRIAATLDDPTDKTRYTRLRMSTTGDAKGGSLSTSVFVRPIWASGDLDATAPPHPWDGNGADPLTTASILGAPVGYALGDHIATTLRGVVKAMFGYDASVKRQSISFVPSEPTKWMAAEPVMPHPSDRDFDRVYHGELSPEEAATRVMAGGGAVGSWLLFLHDGCHHVAFVDQDATGVRYADTHPITVSPYDGAFRAPQRLGLPAVEGAEAPGTNPPQAAGGSAGPAARASRMAEEGRPTVAPAKSVAELCETCALLRHPVPSPVALASAEEATKAGGEVDIPTDALLVAAKTAIPRNFALGISPRPSPDRLLPGEYPLFADPSFWGFLPVEAMRSIVRKVAIQIPTTRTVPVWATTVNSDMSVVAVVAHPSGSRTRTVRLWDSVCDARTPIRVAGTVAHSPVEAIQLFAEEMLNTRLSSAQAFMSLPTAATTVFRAAGTSPVSTTLGAQHYTCEMLAAQADAHALKACAAVRILHDRAADYATQATFQPITGSTRAIARLLEATRKCGAEYDSARARTGGGDTNMYERLAMRVEKEAAAPTDRLSTDFVHIDLTRDAFVDSLVWTRSEAAKITRSLARVAVGSGNITAEGLSKTFSTPGEVRLDQKEASRAIRLIEESERRHIAARTDREMREFVSRAQPGMFIAPHVVLDSLDSFEFPCERFPGISTEKKDKLRAIWTSKTDETRPPTMKIHADVHRHADLVDTLNRLIGRSRPRK